MAPEPYEDTVAHLNDELRRLDVMLRLHLESWWADGPSGGEFSGLYISDEEIDRLLRLPEPIAGDGGTTRHHGAVNQSHGLGDRLETMTREIRARERATAATGTELRLVDLVNRFDLDTRHRDGLLMAIAPELDRKYEKIYAYLQDDVTRTRPTVDLLLRILSGTTVERLTARSAFTQRSPLVNAGLVRVLDDRGSPLPSRTVAVDERIVNYILGSDSLPAALTPIVSYHEPDHGVAQLKLSDDQHEQLERLTRDDADRGPPFVYTYGPDGSAKNAAIEAVCADRGIGVLRAEARILEEGQPDQSAPATERGPTATRLELLKREAALRDAAIHVANVDLSTHENNEDGPARQDITDQVAMIANALTGFAGPVFVSSNHPVSPRLSARVENWSVSTLAFEMPAYDRRLAHWAQIEELPADVDPADLAAKFRLTAGQIADAITTARTIANGEDLTAPAVYAACREQSRERLGTLAQKIETGYTWDDIVLPPDTIAHLREVAAHVKHQGEVYSEWGFDAKYTTGNGLNVLFTGSSGTGKTMAAEILAGDAGLDLYRIDLASVVSKYIGETEENLKAVFDEAEGSNAVLFFDEADALFGQRSEISDAQDRYANVEVSYLLQRMEDHDGTVIMASNLEENIDDAFLRRINLKVQFPIPDRTARAEIWRTVFPEETPVTGLDVEFLAEFDIAGGNIKNAALTAAFLAAEDDMTVEMEHIVQAVQRELEKTGRLVNPEDFGEYQEYCS